MLIEHFPGEPTSFSVIPYHDAHPNQIKLTARTRDEKRQWAQHIKEVMLTHFNIPERAKDLLFQLGQEEDRTPQDKGARKMSSSTIPDYLERRNQCRRSESRHRGKKARAKTFNASLSLVEDNLENLSVSNDPSKNRVIDSMLKELRQRNSIAIRDGNESGGEGVEQGIEAIEEDDLAKGQSALDRAKSKLLEVKIYNTKSLPKRIANLKKQRSKTLKETSRFYTDLQPEEEETTELKITESASPERPMRRRASFDAMKSGERGQSATPTRKHSTASIVSMPNYMRSGGKRDIDIISELLKNHKDFDRILKKTPRKSASLSDVENSSVDSKTRQIVAQGGVLPKPPELPNDKRTLQQRIDEFKQEISLPEPIYESLLRNVHVPYKFGSPRLNRSLSQSHCRTQKNRRPTEAPPKRPESDYVTLAFNDDGNLESVDGNLVTETNENEFRKSDTNISYDAHSENDTTPTSEVPTNSLLTLPKLPERRLSDIGSVHTNIIHRQGSQALGSRIASFDYADPRTLFAQSLQEYHRRSQLLVERISTQSDSSSSTENAVMSISEATTERITSMTSTMTLTTTVIANNESFPFDASKPLPPTPDGDIEVDDEADFDANDDGYYEKNIDSCLENDDVFRDSAIYSDESNEKRYARPEHIYSTISEVRPEPQSTEIVKPIPPPKIPAHKIHPVPFRMAPPPPLPAKPTFTIERPSLKPSRHSSEVTGAPAVPPRNDRLKRNSFDQVPNKELPPTPKRSSSNGGASWVLKQIKNFDK